MGTLETVLLDSDEQGHLSMSMYSGPPILQPCLAETWRRTKSGYVEFILVGTTLEVSSHQEA